MEEQAEVLHNKVTFRHYISSYYCCGRICREGAKHLLMDSNSGNPMTSYYFPLMHPCYTTDEKGTGLEGTLKGRREECVKDKKAEMEVFKMKEMHKETGRGRKGIGGAR